MIDASIIRAHQHASGARGGQEQQALGKSSGGWSSKIHAKVDALGMPLKFIISAGQRQESPFSEQLIGADISDYLIADRGYDSDEFRNILLSRGTTPVIPVKYDLYLYKERNFVERFFNRVKHFRRIATRYDKTVAMYLAGLTLVSILIWIKL